MSLRCLYTVLSSFKTNKNTPLRAQKQQTIFFLHFYIDLESEKPFNTPRRPDSSVGRAED
ncbi:hypothetical protein D8T45_04060 [Vibrio vulnificus]|nr:hypothetical protein D8T45_04060 [Vibrio vulnificus]RZR15225.1 hypothetical protein D8T24_10425 [Vibrio vulnificus]